MSNNKVKGLLKGLRYISQIFDNEKEAEMEIGYPTDVKHVAHIGWDGPSVNSPSWMNEFKTPPSFSSAPLMSLPAPGPGDIQEDVRVSEDCGVKGSNSSAAASSGNGNGNGNGNAVDSKPKPRRSSKSSDQKQIISSRGGKDENHSPTLRLSLPDVPNPRNGRRKKTSSRSKAQVAVAETYVSPFSDPGSGSISVSKDTGLCRTP